MRTLFKIWLSVLLFGLFFYLPLYVISNNAISAVEELTPKDLIPLTGTTAQDPERKERLLASMGIDTSRELEDALEDNKLLSNVDIRYVESEQAHKIFAATGMKVVEARAELAGGKHIALLFSVAPKHFLRSWATVTGLLGVQVSDGQHTINLVDGPADETYIWMLFEKSGKGGAESIQRLTNRFDLAVAGINERERAKNAAATTPTQTLESHTVAGNPSADKIVIFQYEGQPAYCADEGQDGPNCHGDASAFIGQGTYKDYMDEGSALCIAGEAGCVLPDYFPADVRG
ncbi:hypothetical protein F0169_08550 [Pseudomonas sp. MAFF 212408]|uniref:Uncharacterized protein n=1 Tax=Pseudomonas kitaguniensis TaxID=2607908 RepID=A0A5N7KIU0_9PSED|nr:hypothetical protein [Pseudomonas kitaguniensis]MPR02127.1 hypothetical protein [Pseudomonas kitaguniensis]